MPTIIDNTNFRYIKLNEKYIISLSVKFLPSTIFFLDIIKEIPQNLNYDFSIYISKQDPIKVLNSLTYNIGVVSSEISTVNKNQRNIDVLSITKDESSNLRKKIQVENQEIYLISLLFTFYSYDFNQLLKNIFSIKAKFFSKGISVEITNFRHLEFYLSNLPLTLKNIELLNDIYITTDALANIFPFYTTNFIDQDGVLIGYTNENKICMLDIFSPKYENANICIFGSSGSGKSYFTKLFIIRNFFLNRKQIILDIEGEYLNLCNRLFGTSLFYDTYINILEITNNDIKQDSFLDRKIEKVLFFINGFHEIDMKYFRQKLHELYSSFNISNDIMSVAKLEDENIYLEFEIKSSDSFPTLKDLVNYLDDTEQREILIKLIQNELKFFSRKTNIKKDNKLYVLNMSEIVNNSFLVSMIFNYIMTSIYDTKTIIYIDELWKFAYEEKTLEVIFNVYKTIRKRNASIVTITQEITDFYRYKNGIYANTILNNSNFKFLFKSSYSEVKKISDNLSVDYNSILSLKKTETLLLIDKNSVKLKITPNEFERGIINENDIGNK